MANSPVKEPPNAFNKNFRRTTKFSFIPTLDDPETELIEHQIKNGELQPSVTIKGQ